MRWALVIPLLVALSPGRASAQDLPHQDVEADHPGLRSMTVVHYERKGTKLRETHRDVRSYDQKGHVVRIESRGPDKKLRGSSTYEHDGQGRLTKRTHRWAKARPITRTFTYRSDSSGRLLEKIMRDPRAQRGEYFRDAYTWSQDGSYRIRSYRHYDKEGPYDNGTKSYDAKGRLATSCSQNGFCEMIEYDAHGYVSRIRQQNRETHFYLVNRNGYDKQGRLSSREIGIGTTYFVWNARGDIAEERRERGGVVESKTVYTYEWR